MANKKHGLGILDWIDDSLPLRLLKTLSPIALVFGVVSFMFAMADMIADREARAWTLLTREAPGNSGKVQAIEYLNQHSPLYIPNPRIWGIPLGPKTDNVNEAPPREWIRLVSNFGPWKERTSLSGINVSCSLSEKIESQEQHCIDYGPHFEGAYLAHADLALSRFIGAVLVDANFSYASLQAANFREAVLHSATLDGANMWLADFTYADITRATLIDANLDGSELRHATLDQADLTGANLDGANLSNSRMVGAILSDANLNKVDLSAADIANVDFSSAHNMTQEQVDSACPDLATKLPDGLTAKQYCLRTDSGIIIVDNNGKPYRNWDNLIAACFRLEEMWNAQDTGAPVILLPLAKTCFKTDQLENETKQKLSDILGLE